MNQRIATAAIVILLAGGGLTGALSPAALAVAGSYVASGREGGDDLRYQLTLQDSGVAQLVTEYRDASRPPTTEEGAWIIDGAIVQMALNGDGGRITAVSLEHRDGALVAEGEEVSSLRFAGLSFVRVGQPAQPSSPE